MAKAKSAIPKKRKVVKDGIVALGEATGHCHAVAGADVYEADDRFWIAEGAGNLTHQEHETQALVPTGEKVVGIVREYDHFEEEARQVID